MRSPFKFLDSYTAKDKDTFFGRDKEIATLYNLVHKTQMVLVYGLSGTGKSSLVQCGLSTQFDGPDWLPFHIRKNEDINASLRGVLHEAMEGKRSDSLTDCVESLFYTYFRPVYLIFDQFEELFILGKEEEQRQFMEDVRALLDAQLPCKVIFIMREEYIGEFYEFERVLPDIFDYKLRVEPMSNRKVRSVMMQSFAKFNIALEGDDDALCQTMIDNISAGKSGIPLTYLQVYLDMLYREDYARTYPAVAPAEPLPPLEFTREEIDDFGKIDDVLDRYLKEQIAQLQTAAAAAFPDADAQAVTTLLDSFVTEEGTKRPLAYRREGELIRLGESTQKQLNLSPPLTSLLLTELEKARILRFGDSTIELAHDSLALLIDQQRTDAQRQLNDMRRRLQSDYKSWKATGEYLSGKRLATYEDFLPLMLLSNELRTFIEDSRKDIVKREQQALAQKERELALVNEKLATEERWRRRQRVFLVLLVVALVAALGMGWRARKQEQKAVDAQERAKEEKTAAENALNEKNTLQITQLIQDAKTYARAEKYELALRKLDEILGIDSMQIEAIKLKKLYENE